MADVDNENNKQNKKNAAHERMAKRRSLGLRAFLSLMAFFLIVGDAGWHQVPIILIGALGLWVAAVLTIYTGYDYLRAGLRFMTGEAPVERSAGPKLKGPRASPRAG